MFCTNCGNKVDESDLYCNKCGAKQTVQTIQQTINRKNSDVNNEKESFWLSKKLVFILYLISTSLFIVYVLITFFSSLSQSHQEDVGLIIFFIPFIIVFMCLMILPELIGLFFSVASLMIKNKELEIVTLIITILLIPWNLIIIKKRLISLPIQEVDYINTIFLTIISIILFIRLISKKTNNK